MAEIRQFSTGSGIPIWQIRLEVFPGFYAFVYWVEAGDRRVLVDTGSGWGTSNEHLEAGLAAVAETAGRPAELDSLTHVLVTHGHIDHFGGLGFIRERSKARIGIHELDLRNVTRYEERIFYVKHLLENFFIEAGLAEARREAMLATYLVNKGLFRSTEADFTFEAASMQVGPFELLHVPGHCAGQVVIRLEDVIFAGDVVLSRTTPHMAPESLTHHTGLAHYLASLEKLERWAGGIALTLPGHEDPIPDLPARIREILAHHDDRLARILDLLDQPKTIAEISDELFGAPKAYNAILAVEEAGAHVEYLYQRGEIGIANVAELENTHAPIPLRYVRNGPSRDRGGD